MKTIFDLVLCLLTCPIWGPVCLLLYLLVLLKHGYPCFFRQKRPGKGGKIFELVKFRTMTNERDKNGELRPDAERLTELGKWLRSTSLDELSELINVLKGEMSLVGPRPLLVKYLDLYSDEQARRHDVKPGITGLAQVKGRNSISWEEKFKWDIEYVNKHNIFMDLNILWMTLTTVLLRKGISSEGHATMPEFEGSFSNSGSDKNSG